MLSVLLMAPALVTPPRASSAVWRERMRAQRHIRPHVNPLQRRFQLPAALDLEDLAFAQPQAIHVDVGCGKGHFCADLAEARPDLNVLGIEIRDPLVEEHGQSAVSGAPQLATPASRGWQCWPWAALRTLDEQPCCAAPSGRLPPGHQPRPESPILRL